MTRASIILACFCLGVPVASAGQDERPPGISHRVLWTTSRLVGSPDPPLPYTVEQTFTKIAWKGPLFVAQEPGTDMLVVVLRGGEADNPSRIVRVRCDPAAEKVEPFLEMSGRLIYAVCFHPDYQTNGWIYIFSNGPNGDPDRVDRISRFAVARDDPRAVDPKSETTIIEWPSAGHDGGDLAFGLDRMLYITTGDGSQDSDTLNSGQTLDDLLGSVLRIDVDHAGPDRAYTVPADNPFVSLPPVRGEIWAYGLRNPWRLAVDAKTGHLWVGNNGQDQWETAHLVKRGENYGWSVLEGSHPFYLERKRGPTPLVPPTIEHSHAEFRSLTGGVVYYGSELPDLNGAYVYGDYSSGRIWGMKHDGQRVVWHRELADTSLQIVGFGVDQRGELLIVDLGSGLYRLVPTLPVAERASFPTRLSDSGLFANTAEHRPAAGMVPYSVNAPGWNDGAHAERFFAVPGDLTIKHDPSKSWDFPEGSVLMETLSLERQPGDATSRFRVETRVLLRQQGEWAGYSYRWTADQRDASLVERQGADAELTLAASAAGSRKQSWRFPSRADCMTCHSRAANFVLGLCDAQLNRDHDDSGTRDNQLRTLDHLGMFSSPLPKPPAELAKWVDFQDASQDLEARVRAYLQVNCAVCHVAAGGGNSQMDLLVNLPREKMNLLGARPQHDTFGIANAMLVAPGDPQRSVLVHRLSRRGPGQMPPLMSTEVDERAVKLMTDWIGSLKPKKAIVRQWQLDDLLPLADQVRSGRSPAAGAAAFRETGCIECHRFGGEGGSVGPDLASVGKRLAVRELMESILLPSKVIADEYATHAIETTTGKVVSGRIEREDDRVVVLRAAADPPVEIAKEDIVERRRLDRSNMPSGTIDVLHQEQVLDLLAYLLGDGKPAEKSP